MSGYVPLLHLKVTSRFDSGHWHLSQKFSKHLLGKVLSDSQGLALLPRCCSPPTAKQLGLHGPSLGWTFSCSLFLSPVDSPDVFKQHADAKLGLSTRNIFTGSPCPCLEGDKLTKRAGCSLLEL